MEDIIDTLFKIIPTIIVGYSVIYLWILPMNRVRTLDDDVGFAHITGKQKKGIINRLRKTRKTGKIPPPYPNGWYALAESREVLIIP